MRTLSVLPLLSHRGSCSFVWANGSHCETGVSWLPTGLRGHVGARGWLPSCYFPDSARVGKGRAMANSEPLATNLSRATEF